VRAGKAEIVVARFAGYCYGVERALRLTGEALESAPAPVATLGPIIHNPRVVGSLRHRGVDVVDEVDEATVGTLIVRTHGVSPDVIAHARSRHLNVVDATCPFVSVAQRKAAALREAGYAVVILGERDHPEVVGLEGFAGTDAVVVEDAAGLPLDRLRGRRVGVVVQTTQTRANLSALTAALAPVARELLVFNTVCDATEKRQSAACELAEDVEVVVVVGSHPEPLERSCRRRYEFELPASVPSGEHAVARQSEIVEERRGCGHVRHAERDRGQAVKCHGWTN